MAESDFRPEADVDPILKQLKASRSEMLSLLRRLVEYESPSNEKAAVNQLGSVVASEFKALGARVIEHRSTTTGDHLEVRMFGTSSGPATQGGGILLLGHLDTVWASHTLMKMPFRISRGRAYGPGAYDMKGGIVQGLFALRCLRELGLQVPKPVTFLLNADEEIGSPSSRSLTERLARMSEAALVLEPSYGPNGALKTSRKGVGEFRVRIQGKAAHAGLDPRRGASATLELAKQIIKIQSLTDNSRGITLNTGVISGGTRSNVVAAQAEAIVDVRIRCISDAGMISKRLLNLRPNNRRTSILVSGGMNRPPFERSPEVANLFRLARTLAQPLGIKLTEASVGGGSDGNFTAALGVATLDGLGAVGDGAHSLNEHIVIAEMPRRAALLAHLIARLANNR